MNRFIRNRYIQSRTGKGGKKEGKRRREEVKRRKRGDRSEE